VRGLILDVEYLHRVNIQSYAQSLLKRICLVLNDEYISDQTLKYGFAKCLVSTFATIVQVVLNQLLI
jgi:hypothetical protein